MGRRATPLSSLERPAIATEESLSQGADGLEIEQAQTAELGVPRLRRFDPIGRSRRHSSFALAALVSASCVCGASLPVSENPTTTSEGSRFVARAVTIPCCGVVNECVVDSNELDSAPGAKTVRPHGFGRGSAVCGPGKHKYLCHAQHRALGSSNGSPASHQSEQANPSSLVKVGLRKIW